MRSYGAGYTSFVGLFATSIIAGLSILCFLRWPERGFAALLFLLPFSIALNPYPGIDLLLLRVLAPLLWVAVLMRFPHAFMYELKKPATLLLGLFCAVAALSIVFASEPLWALRKLLYLWSLAPLLPAFSVLLRDDPRGLRATNDIVATGRRGTSAETAPNALAAHLLVWGAVLAALVGITLFVAQFVIGADAVERMMIAAAPYVHGRDFGALVISHPSWFVNAHGRDYLRAFALFPDPHIFAFYMNMIGAVVLALALRTRDVKAFITWIVCYAVMVLAATLSFSRGGYLGYFAATCVVAACVFRWRTWSSAGSRLVQLAAIGFGSALLLLLLNAPVAGRFLSSFDAGEGSNIGRLELWQDAAAVWRRHPLGVGLGNYAATVDDRLDIRNPVTAHNVYLDILVETGLVGIAAFVGALGYAAYMLYRQAANGSSLAAGSLGGLSAVAVHGFFENPLWSPALFLLILLTLAIAQAEAERGVETPERHFAAS